MNEIKKNIKNRIYNVLYNGIDCVNNGMDCGCSKKLICNVIRDLSKFEFIEYSQFLIHTLNGSTSSLKSLLKNSFINLVSNPIGYSYSNSNSLFVVAFLPSYLDIYKDIDLNCDLI
jgi:hypothetical protein